MNSEGGAAGSQSQNQGSVTPGPPESQSQNQQQQQQQQQVQQQQSLPPATLFVESSATSATTDTDSTTIKPPQKDRFGWDYFDYEECVGHIVSPCSAREYAGANGNYTDFTVLPGNMRVGNYSKVERWFK